ncbi:MAG: hypothetical protein J6K88_00770 [Oscillospiraceae bacterium]|nr:hypothetical protein [Oscillospiraceae bacterium]
MKIKILVSLSLFLLCSCEKEVLPLSESSYENSSPLYEESEILYESSASVSEVFYEKKEPIRFLYGKSLLSAEEKKAYEIIDKAIRSFSSSAKIEGITDTDSKKILEYYLSDNPDIFQLSDSYKLISKGDKITLEFSYVLDKESYYEKLSEVEAATEKIIKDAENKSDYNKALAIHNFLCKEVSYAKTENAYSILGALADKKAVCEGYSKAFKYLAEKLGLRAILVHGEASSVPHSWNMVEISGKFYHLDITNDDYADTTIYSHFLITEEEMRSAAAASDMPLPKSTSRADNYYIKEGLFLSDFNPNKIEKLLSSFSENLPLRFAENSQREAAKKFILSKGYSVITAKTGIENKVFDLTIKI